jgi:hypothetical protein
VIANANEATAVYYSMLMRLSRIKRLTPDIEPATEDELALLRLEDVRSGDPVRRKEALRGLMRKVLTAAALHLGEEEALELWHEVAQRKPGKKGSRRPLRDEQLLWLYDELCKRMPKKAVPGWIGAFLSANDGFRGKYGPSAPAIDRHVRRLVQQREGMSQCRVPPILPLAI